MSNFSSYEHCELCPRRCGVNRVTGQRGFCGESNQLHIASIVAHFGEEPPLVGSRSEGSGTIFFSGCSTGCFFCQNYQLSTGHTGEIISTEECIKRLLALAETGIRNFNLVTPEHFWPHIKELIDGVHAADCWLPWIWNCSGYFRKEMLEEQSGMVDIFLPDFKYAVPELAQRCMGRSDYPMVARDGIRYLVERLGFLRPFDETGEMPASRGVLVRHLVLPGEVENSLSVLNALYDDFGPRMPISIMRQFRPMPECFRRNDLTRMVSDEEYNAVLAEVERLGFIHVFIQPDCGDPNFVPDFTRTTQPFAGNITPPDGAKNS